MEVIEPDRMKPLRPLRKQLANRHLRLPSILREKGLASGAFLGRATI
jgi:hypothetical protein